MKKIILTHKVFFVFFALFLMVGVILLFQIEKGDTIIFFSENRSPFWDAFFRIGTKFGEEVVYAIIGIVYLFIQFRISVMIALIGVVVTIVSYLTKAFFALDRPSLYFYKIGNIDQIIPVEGVHMLTGTSSFPSGHTMSAFAFYGLLTFLLPPKKQFAVLFFALALIVGISRIYLVQHFLQDVLAGALIGILIGMLFYWFHEKYPSNPEHLIDRSLINLKSKKV